MNMNTVFALAKLALHHEMRDASDILNDELRKQVIDNINEELTSLHEYQDKVFTLLRDFQKL